MKQITKKAILFPILFLCIISQVSAMGAKRPKVPPTPTPVPAPQNPPVPPTHSGPYLDQIKELAASSSCANYAWKNRGRAPAGYIKGVSLSFARSICRLNLNALAPSPLAAIIGSANSHNDKKDALTHYENSFLQFPIQIDTAGIEPMRATYLLGMGLGMRESSGAYCEGWDTSAGSNRPSSAAEAGLFQTSYDSIAATPELAKLYSEYKTTSTNSNRRCFLDVFKEGASCRSSNILGTGAGADFQAFNKACPAFATEYAMTMLRIQRSHYGPINRLEAEVVPACNQLLKNVQELIVRDYQNACQDIF
jgi:hypothetical protein